MPYKYRIIRVSVPHGRGAEPLELPGRIIHVLDVSDSETQYFSTLQVLVEEADASD